MTTQLVLEIAVETERQYRDVLRVIREAGERGEIDFEYSARPSLSTLDVLAQHISDELRRPPADDRRE